MKHHKLNRFVIQETYGWLTENHPIGNGYSCARNKFVIILATQFLLAIDPVRDNQCSHRRMQTHADAPPTDNLPMRNSSSLLLNIWNNKDYSFSFIPSVQGVLDLCSSVSSSFALIMGHSMLISWLYIHCLLPYFVLGAKVVFPWNLEELRSRK